MAEKIRLLGKTFKIVYPKCEGGINDTLSFSIGGKEEVIIALHAETPNANFFCFGYYAEMKTYALFKERLDDTCKAELSDSVNQVSFKIENDKIFCKFNITRITYSHQSKRCYTEGISIDWHELVEI